MSPGRPPGSVSLKDVLWNRSAAIISLGTLTLFLVAGLLDARVEHLVLDWTRFNSGIGVLVVTAVAQLLLAVAVLLQIRSANHAAEATDHAAEHTARAALATEQSVTAAAAEVYAALPREFGVAGHGEQVAL